jgi:hypothetical protein
MTEVKQPNSFITMTTTTTVTPDTESKATETTVNQQKVVKKIPLSIAFPHGNNLNGMHAIYTMHPAEVRDGLLALTKQNKIKRVVHEQDGKLFELYHYVQTFDEWSEISLCGRSSVFWIKKFDKNTDDEEDRTDDWNIAKVVIPGYEKFFELEQLNREEVLTRYASMEFLATEKLDGEACHFTVMEDGTFIICSTESFKSKVTECVRCYIYGNRVTCSHLRPGYVYTVELVDSQIVCRYPIEFDGIYLIRVVTPEGRILSYEERVSMADELSLKIVPLCKFKTFSDLVLHAESIRDGPLALEGYVVEFRDGFCLKIKTPLYYKMVENRCHMTKDKVFDYCITGKMPKFTCDTARKQFERDGEDMLKKLTELANPICKFVRENMHVTDNKKLIELAVAAGINSRSFTFIKSRDDSVEAMKRYLFRGLYTSFYT